jgi:uncharacterized protein
MKFLRFIPVFLLLFALPQLDRPAHAQPKKKKLLCIGAVKGFQHDATSHGLATLWKLGQESGLWDTYVRTDTQLLTKKTLTANAKNLDYFDAVAFYTTGELDMDDEQKASLLSFVKDDGKGFVGIHSAMDTFYKWPEYGEMVGGYFNEHPWGTFQAPVIVEDPSNPIAKHFAKEFITYDEIYQAKDFSRDRVRVLMRLDENKIDLANPRVHRADKDFAVAWMRNYGKGHVFYSTFGHTYESWDRADVQKMWLEAVKWSMHLTEADATPRARPTN